MASEGRSGQRQDVAFLALAVAVLAVAVALFLGMRSIDRRPDSENIPPPSEQAEMLPPQLVESPDGVARDPFVTGSGGTATPSTTTPASSQTDLKLVGIVRQEGATPLAIIHSNNRRYYVKSGARAAGYTVQSIGENEVVLVREADKVRLILRKPPEIEE